MHLTRFHKKLCGIFVFLKKSFLFININFALFKLWFPLDILLMFQHFFYLIKPTLNNLHSFFVLLLDLLVWCLFASMTVL